MAEDPDHPDRIGAAAGQVIAALGRRRLLGGGLALGGAAAATTLLAASPATAAPPVASPRHRRTVVYDVAMLGESFKVIAGPDIDNFDLRGTTFYVEGPIYPGGTIPDNRADWDPSQHTSEEIGHWFDIGSFMSFRDRPNPHLYGTMTHVFGLITATNNFPPDTITSTGTEASVTQDTIPSTRAITGGTGRFVGASGQITLFGHGTNVTNETVLGRVAPAPNLRFIFSFSTAE
jgi:hypothetical protein